MHQFINHWAKAWRRFLGRFGRPPRLLLLLLTAVMTAACSSTAINHSEISDSELPSTNCYMVQHEMGETCISRHPKRIITIPFSFVGNVLVLDIKPIGSTLPFGKQSELTASHISTETHLGDRVKEVHNIGTTHMPNLERILKLKPDLILAWNRSSITQIYPKLSQIAPTVVVPYKFSNHWAHSNFIAEILRKQDIAQQAKELYYQRIESLKSTLGDQYYNKEFSAITSTPSGSIAYTRSSFLGLILNDLELKRPAPQDITPPSGAIFNISDEELKTIDGDILFFLVFGNESIKSFNKLQKSPLWQTLRAVREEQVYLVDGDAWVGANLLAADVVIDDLYKYLVNTPSSDT